MPHGASCYDVDIVEHDHRFHSDLPPSRVWSFEGSFGGPVIDVRYGQPFCLRFHNRLPANHRGYGQPEPCTHLHNFHTASESDGGPWNWQAPGTSRIQHYCMARAGFADPLGAANPFYNDTTGQSRTGSWWDPDGTGDLRETLTTLFCHDHRPEFTAANLYKGLFMMVRAFDEDDTGDETTGWRLPSGDYDVPLLLQDKEIVAETGEMTFNQFATDGFLGGYLTVNGGWKPLLRGRAARLPIPAAQRRPVALLSLRAAQPAAVYVKFAEITRSGNLLPVPAKNLTKLELWVAERSDIIVDFSGLPDGAEIFMSNTLEDARRRARRGCRQHAQPGRPEEPAAQVRRAPQAGELPAASRCRPTSGRCRRCRTSARCRAGTSSSSARTASGRSTAASGIPTWTTPTPQTASRPMS